MEQLKVLFTEDEIRRKVVEIAHEIRRDYQGKRPLLVGILKGSFVFMADLMRALRLHVEIEFVQLSSYGRGRKESTGKIRMVRRLTTPIRGKDVLVVEDIADSGHTLKFVLDYLERKKPSSLKLCVLVDKVFRREVDLPIDYVGFRIEKGFVVGYGIDYDERFRYLKDICIVDEES